MSSAGEILPRANLSPWKRTLVDESGKEYANGGMETGLERPSLYSLSDAELVDLAAEGDAAAFDCLVLRHRESVLQAARAILGDWNMAEDAAQHALLEAFKGLRGLREPEKFKAWLMTITRRCALHLIPAEAEIVEFSESVIQPLAEPFVPDGLIERVTAHLHELSSRSRRVITLHYLDGYSCREIGTQLHIPEGTVKRILHESRNSLRASMGMAIPRVTGGREMKARTGPRHLVWWINGNWPGPYMQGLLAQSICLTANKTAKSMEQIARTIDANPEFVREAIGPLVREELVSQIDDRYITNYVALDAEDWISITKDVRRHGKLLADRLGTCLPALEKAWGKSSFPSRGFPWSTGIWPMLALFVANQGVARNSAAPPLPEAPTHKETGKRYSAGGREVVPEEYVLWGTGFSIWSSDAESFCYGQFWTWGLDRVYLETSERYSAILGAIDSGDPGPASIAQTTIRPVDQVEESLARLVELGVIERREGRLSLAFPVVRQEDSDVLAPMVDTVSAQLSADILAPATADVADKLRAAGYGHLESQFPEWRRWFEGDICGEALKELLSRGVLPDPGQPAPARFALIGWKGQLPLITWRR